jgi:hypothetical protein
MGGGYLPPQLERTPQLCDGIVDIVKGGGCATFPLSSLGKFTLMHCK